MRVVEVCAGMGSMSLGFQQAGFKHVALIEKEAKCVEILNKNAFSNVIHADVETFDFRPYKGVEVVCGGVPCQPFSIAGKHKGQNDARNLWPHVIRAVKEIEPRGFLFENSSAMCSKTHREYLESIIQEFRRLGFNVWQFRIDCADYGVPMHRKRLILVGLRDGTFTPPSKTPHITVGQAISVLGPPNGINNHTLHTSTPRNYPGHTSSTLNRPSKSIVSGCHGPGGGNCCLTFDDGSLRYYTPREAATLMTLPSTFQLPTTFSPAMKMIGNAAPVEMIRRFAEQLEPHLITK